MASNKSSEAFEALKQYLIENHRAKVVSGGREILKRCHICGDSRDLSDAHMYIGVKDGVIVYNCFKCNAGGSVDGRFLRDMDCYDPNIIYLCNEQNKNSSGSNSSYSGGFKTLRTRHMVFPFYNDAFAAKKMGYINNRLGLNLNQSDLANLKIVLNLKQFLNANGITKYTRDPELMDLLDKFFIGFVSMDNTYVILRRLVPEGKLPSYIDYRYINYNIFGNNQGMKHYIIPMMINTLRPLNIHIAEGTFDIISIYRNVVTPYNANNDLFAAVCGKTYLSLIKHFIIMYGFNGFTLHIYPDSDIPDYEMMRIKKEVSLFNIKIFVHRNMYPGEKDYGVSPDKINDTSTRI